MTSLPTNRRIRVFVSSTFRDMMEERDELMTHTWPELRRFCHERQVELVEVDLRWGIAEEQSTRKETLKLCLDEIRACRPFFIGLLGERYGWTPGDDAFTADLKEEQSWLKDLHGKSVTELEILHGVLNNPDMAGRAYFYFRNPKYVESVPADRKTDFATENAEKQKQLKDLIKETSVAKRIPLHENYSDPVKLAALVVEDLKAAIEMQFPKADIPDALTREARDHEAFAETRRRTYIGRPDYFEALDCHAMRGGASPSPPSEGGEGRGEVGDKPFVLLGDSGSGKSALLANWLAHWHQTHPTDFIFQHYIGGTPDSADHWRLMTRLTAEIKRWSGDPDDVPCSHDDLLRDFPIWLAKARSKAAHDGVRFIVVLDALNQLDDRDHARALGWLSSDPFNGALRLIVSTLPGDTLEGVKARGWQTLHVEPLTEDERRRMIAHYLGRFGKKLDVHRLERLAAAPASANPLYLKILLDELRVTGTHYLLDERLNDYLSAPDIPSLLKEVLARYQRDYERDLPGLVGEALGLIWAARRGLTENELLRLLKPADKPQLAPAIWNPLRAALEDGLVDRGGILNFAHDFLRTAVETAYVPDESKRIEFRLRLSGFFETEPVAVRSSDELPWLLWKTLQRDRLRTCLLDISRFLVIREYGEDELLDYWVLLHEERTMGQGYRDAFFQWMKKTYSANDSATIKDRELGILPFRLGVDWSMAANDLSKFLLHASLIQDAEILSRLALSISDSETTWPGQVRKGVDVSNLARTLFTQGRHDEAEPLCQEALAIAEANFGPDDDRVGAELNNLATVFIKTGREADAEPLLRRALAIHEKNLGPNASEVAIVLNNLVPLLQNSNRLTEAEVLARRALAIDEQHYGATHSKTAIRLNALARILQSTQRLSEAETLYRRALAADENHLGPHHTGVATDLNNLATLLLETKKFEEAEALLRRSLAIEERVYGSGNPEVIPSLNNLAQVLEKMNRMAEAEPLARRALESSVAFSRKMGRPHPYFSGLANNYAKLLAAMGLAPEDVIGKLKAMAPDVFANARVRKPSGSP